MQVELNGAKNQAATLNLKQKNNYLQIFTIKYNSTIFCHPIKFKSVLVVDLELNSSSTKNQGKFVIAHFMIQSNTLSRFLRTVVIVSFKIIEHLYVVNQQAMNRFTVIHV